MRAPSCLALLLLVACGGSPRSTVHEPHASSAPLEVGAVRLVVHRRPTAGRIAAGLFVQAPDGSPAMRAVAGWVLEEACPGLVARATPEGLTLRARVDRDELGAALATLARALATRDATEEATARALERLTRHRASRARDDRALAQRLAVEALSGAELDPFGDPRGDAELTASAVRRWLESTLGAERALVVVVGDVDEATAREAVAAALADAPHVAPALRVPATWSPSAARVALGERDVAAAATTAATLDEAMRVAAWVPHLVPAAEALAFPLRGRGVVVATSEGGADAVVALASALRRAHQIDEEAPSATAYGADDELLAIGDAWLAGATGETSDAIGLARVRRGAPDEDAAPTEDATLDARAAAPAPSARTIDEARGAAVLPNGMHASVARAEGDEVAVALSFDVGAALDPAREHGRTALLAAVLARSCEPDADRAWVDARRFGVVVRGDRASLERTVLRAIDCARRARDEIAHTEGVRASAIADLGPRERLRAWAASVLSPAAPGRVAPGGSAAGLAAATELDVALDDALDARRATLAVVGDASPEHLLRVAEAMGEALSARTGPIVQPAASGPSASDAYLTDAEADVPLAIVALRADVGASPVAARHVARALARALATRGLAVRAAWGGAALDDSYVAVAVTGADAALDALPTTARALLPTLEVVAGLADEADAEARTRALELGDPAVLARSLAAGSEPDADPVAVARALASSTPRFVMVRPTSTPLRRR